MKFAVVLALFAVFAVSAIQAAPETPVAEPEVSPVAEDAARGFNLFGFIINGVKSLLGKNKNNEGINQMQEMIEKIKKLAEKKPEAARIVNEVRANPLSIFNHIDDIMALLQEAVGEQSAKETVAVEEAVVEEAPAVKQVDAAPETPAADGKKKGFNLFEALKNTFKNIDGARRRLGTIWNEFVENPASLAKNIDELKSHFEFGKGLIQQGMNIAKAITGFSCNPLSMTKNFDDVVQMITGEKPEETAVQTPAEATVTDRAYRAFNIVMELRCNPFSFFSNFDEIADLVDEMVPDSEPGKPDNPLQIVANIIRTLADRREEAVEIFIKMRTSSNPLEALQYVDDIVRVIVG